MINTVAILSLFFIFAVSQQRLVNFSQCDVKNHVPSFSALLYGGLLTTHFKFVTITTLYIVIVVHYEVLVEIMPITSYNVVEL